MEKNETCGKIGMTDGIRLGRFGHTSRKRIKILIIDDEKAIRFTMKKMLEKENFTVYTAEDGDAAKSLVEKYEFDIIIADLIIPGTDGFGIITELRETYGITSSVIFMSGRNAAYSPDFAAMSSEFLSKPFGRRELMERIWKVLTVREKGMRESISGESELGAGRISAGAEFSMNINNRAISDSDGEEKISDDELYPEDSGKGRSPLSDKTRKGYIFRKEP